MIELFSLLLIDWVFFTIAAILIISITWLSDDNEHVGWSHTLFIALVTYIAYKYGYTLAFIKANPVTILKYVGTYLSIGVAWSFIKWYFTLKNISVKYDELKEEAMQKLADNKKMYGHTYTADEEKAWLQESLYNKYDHYSSSKIALTIERVSTDDVIKGSKKKDVILYTYNVKPPRAIENKGVLISWISHWPISLGWTFLNDPIRKLINWIFNIFKNTFQKISDRIFRNIALDFERVTVKKEKETVESE